MSGNGLFGSTILDVAIGLLFVYLVLSLVCTTVNEWIAGIWKIRSKTLKSAIVQMLDNQPYEQGGDTNWFLNQFYSHPLINGMTKPGNKEAQPSYLASRTFSTVVLDILTPGKVGAVYDDLKGAIETLPDGDVRKVLLALIRNANNDINPAQKNIEGWFDDTMDRVSGWYKRKTQVWTVVIAAALTLACNADTIRITRQLWRDPTERSQLVERAKARATKPGAGQTSPVDANPAEAHSAQKISGQSNPAQPNPAQLNPVQTISSSRAVKDHGAEKDSDENDLENIGELIGWAGMPKGREVWIAVLGWILTIVAVSLGAPFWFDVLKKFMQIRNAGQLPKDKPNPPENPPAKTAAPTQQKTT